jgi:integrase
MAKVKKRKWTTKQGESREAWICDYTDQDGVRRLKTFATKKEADAFRDQAMHEVRSGTHTPHSTSITVAQAAEDWFKYVELENRERSTLEFYKNHITRHINPRLGNEKLARLTAPRIEKFRDDLLADLSRMQAKKVLVSLKSILRDAVRRGSVAQNVATAVKIKSGERDRKRIVAGTDIPTPDEVRAILHAATGRIRPLLITLVFTGLRSSELRGLTWDDVDLAKGELHVRQRADRYGQIGAPKSRAGERTIPIGPIVVNTLREHRLSCPKGELNLVFPNVRGKIWDHNHLVTRLLHPVVVDAGVVNASSKAKYTGLHAFRHFYASWLINRKVDGGLELPIKTVQQRLWHSSIMMTSDVYGHLFPRTDDGRELAEAERGLMAVS